MGKYRILHVIKGLGQGGAETLLLHGIEFSNLEAFTYGYCYFLPWKDALVSELRGKDVDVMCVGSVNSAQIFLSIPRLARLFKRWKANLIHCHLPIAGVVGRLAARFCGIPVVYTEHNVMERYHPWTRRVNLATWKMQAKVIAVSGEVATSIRKHAGDSVPVQIVRNGIPVNQFNYDEAERTRIRYELGIPRDAPVVGTVAVFRTQKNLKLWLEAAAELCREFPQLHFILVGDGPLKSDLIGTANCLNIQHVVHFPGLQKNVSAYLSAMDVFVSTSVFEGLPIALLEAMAIRLPVVATSVGGVPEVVAEGKSGFLIPPEHKEELVERISLLLVQSKLRNTFGIAGRKLVEERFSMARMACELEQCYRELLPVDES